MGGILSSVAVSVDFGDSAGKILSGMAAFIRFRILFLGKCFGNSVGKILSWMVGFTRFRILLSAKRPLQFGDKETADVLLRVINSEGAEYEGNPLCLHSHVLRKSDFFEAMMSERWSHSEVRPLELKVSIPYNVNDYVKCIEAMYLSHSAKRISLSSVQQTLAILPIASELMFQECVDFSLRYLEAVRWTPEENLQIRALFSRLQLNLPPDLAARLGVSECQTECDHVKMTEEILGELLPLISSGSTPMIVEITERIIVANFEANASPALANATKAALLKEIRSNLDVIKADFNSVIHLNFGDSHRIVRACTALQWLLRRRLCFDMAVAMFSQERYLAKEIVLKGSPRKFQQTLLSIIVLMVQILVNGEVICDRSVRLAFLTTWIPVIQCLIAGDDIVSSDKGNLEVNLVEGLSALIETLPLVDQEQILKIWLGSYQKFPKSNLGLNTIFDSWYKKLLKAHHDTQASLELDVFAKRTQV